MTEVVAEATETTESFDIDAYAETGVEPFVSTVWPQVRAQLNEMETIKEDLRKYSPPGPLDISNYIKGDGQNDPQIKELYAKVKELQAAVTKLSQRMNERAGELLNPQTLPESELSERKAKFATLRKTIQDQVHVLTSFADAMDKTELAAALRDIKVPQFVTGLGGAGTVVRNPETTAVREWAKENGIEVSERGRVPDAVWEQYRKAQSNGSAE